MSRVTVTQNKIWRPDRSGATVLGNITVGEGAKIGAGSVVLADVAPHTTVVGIPATQSGKPNSEAPAETMQQNFLADSDQR